MNPRKVFLFGDDFDSEDRLIIKSSLDLQGYEICNSADEADVVLVRETPENIHLVGEAYLHARQDGKRRVIYLRLGWGDIDQERFLFSYETACGVRCFFDAISYPYLGEYSAKFLQTLASCIAEAERPTPPASPDFAGFVESCNR